MAEGLVAQGSEPAVLHAIEVDEEREEDIRRHLAMAGVADRVQLHIGDALAVLPTLAEQIDLAFIDADKRHTLDYYELLLPKLRQNGLLIIDNTLWGGKVLDENPTAKEDKDTQIVRSLNDHILNDPRVDTLLLPLRDGLTLCRKK